MIGRLAGLLEDAVERFLNAVVDALIRAWIEADQ